MLSSRPTLEVEAKCLRAGSHPISGYTGNDGLQLFVNGEYAQNQLFGAMLGYMQSGDAAYWTSQLFASIQSGTSLVGDCTVLTEFAFEHAYLSHHGRTGLTNIAMHHFLLPCT